jgi:hypothetical protein
VSTVAMPRKTYVPSPPAPTAAAMVAVPTETTAAMRTPARITGKARGSSTMRSRCASVMPRPVAASITARSTSRMPVYVLRRMGSSA